MKITALFLSLLVTLAGCQNPDPQLTTPAAAAIPPQVHNTMEVTADGVKIAADAQFDILFVIDDSKSMREHQENLSRNVNEFVKAFASVKAIDFHIGFTNVHDNYRYGSIVPEVCGNDTSTPGRRNWAPPGTLQPIIGPVDKMLPNGRRYLTRDDDYLTLLRTSLDPSFNRSLIKDLVNPDPKHPTLCAQGPELEESSTPILGAISDANVMNGINKGFRRKNAFFVAIVVSDAKDEYLTYNDHLPTDPSRPKDQVMRARLTIDDFIARVSQTLGETKDKRRFRIFSVVIDVNQKVGPRKASGECMADPAFSEPQPDNKVTYKFGTPTNYVWPENTRVQLYQNPLVDIAHKTEDDGPNHLNQVLSICSPDYGKDLANFGQQVQRDAVTNVTINLRYPPELKKGIHVTLAGDELVEGRDWVYNPMHGGTTITVYGQNIDWRLPKYANEQIHVSFTPITDPKNLRQTY